jgi:hypothetical protein
MLIKGPFIQKFVPTKPSLRKRHAVVYCGDFGKILCVEQRGPPQPYHPASCDVIKYALLYNRGEYPKPFKARALSGNR